MMNKLKVREFVPNTVYYVMSEQPNFCPFCQTRLDIVEYVLIDQEITQVNHCDDCDCEILMIEEDDEI